MIATQETAKDFTGACSQVEIHGAHYRVLILKFIN